ncbi:hypothetical protein GEV33_007682 [Tenebrio molitor]|uniref:DUF5641 domain-containing protein n=1 Tax=Tenebrio molitor TaxID=7067 RepID=A0A8J6LAU8_TENMO|nr:hypothetical protein GEV33_007682 [Tenebrio molitor]
MSVATLFDMLAGTFEFPFLLFSVYGIGWRLANMLEELDKVEIEKLLKIKTDFLSFPLYELTQALIGEWESIPQDSLRRLVRSMPRRCEEVIRTRGGLSGLQQSESGLRIFIKDWLKTSGIKRNQPVLSIPYFQKKPKLYVDGHASTSSAHRLGISMNQIKQCAGCSPNSETFVRFYNRPVVDPGQYKVRERSSTGSRTPTSGTGRDEFAREGAKSIKGGTDAILEVHDHSSQVLANPWRKTESAGRVVQRELQPYAAADLGFIHEGPRPYASADQISPPFWAAVIPQDPSREPDLTPDSPRPGIPKSRNLKEANRVVLLESDSPAVEHQGDIVSARASPLVYDTYKIPSNIKLADPTFNKPGPIDLLLGNELFWKVLCVGKVQLGPAKRLIAQNTQLGWILGGCWDTNKENTKTICTFSSKNLEKQMVKFWQIEEIDHKPILSREHESDITKMYRQIFIDPAHRDFLRILCEIIPMIRYKYFGLKRVIGNANLTFEELYTVLTSIEAILNSRPLCPLSNDPNDLSYLTPGHFLVGEPLNAPAEFDLTDVNIPRLSRWQHVERIRQHFWKRWSNEYLTTLQQRTRWITSKDKVPHVGSLVLIKETNAPPLQWKLGRITQLHPGPDKVVNFVKIGICILAEWIWCAFSCRIIVEASRVRSRRWLVEGLKETSYLMQDEDVQTRKFLFNFLGLQIIFCVCSIYIHQSTVSVVGVIFLELFSVEIFETYLLFFHTLYITTLLEMIRKRYEGLRRRYERRFVQNGPHLVQMSCIACSLNKAVDTFNDNFGYSLALLICFTPLEILNYLEFARGRI